MCVIVFGGVCIYVWCVCIVFVVCGCGIVWCVVVEDELVLSVSVSFEVCVWCVCDGDVMLICGEGDFFFVFVFVMVVSVNVCIVVILFVVREEVVEVWRGGDNVDALRKRSNCRVEYGVDVMMFLMMFVKEMFDCVLFNFLYILGKVKMDRNWELLAAYLREALRVASNGFVECALAFG